MPPVPGDVLITTVQQGKFKLDVVPRGVPWVVPAGSYPPDRGGHVTGDRAFGQEVRERRRTLGLTQKKLARLLGCSPVTVQKLEEGHRRPSPHLARALAQHLNIGAAEIVAFLRSAQEAPVIPRRPVTPPGNPVPDGTRSSALPTPPTPFLGRAPERRTLARLLTRGARPVVTLIGPPGVGKTRLALEVARDVQAEFEQVHFIPLTTVLDARQVWAQTARLLGLTLGARPPLDRLAVHLGRRRILLVLDNFEHVLAAAADLHTLLEQAPGVRVLVTSREALHLSAEQVWALAPLGLPSPEPQALARLRRVPAVALFTERAAASWPEFRLTASTAPDVARIVRWCDGLPLALELAAGQIGPLSAAEVWAALQAAPLALLGEGPLDVPARQRSVHAAVAWTYDRLDHGLQQDFRHLGVFVGGFSAAAAGALGVARLALDALLRLGLVRRHEFQGRYSLLEPLRAFALEHLAFHGELDAAQQEHATQLLHSQDTPIWRSLGWVAAELDNVRAALRWAIGHARPDLALRLALGVSWYLEIHGLQREELAWFDEALAVDGGNAALRLQVMVRSATPAWQVGRHALAAGRLHAALPHVRTLGAAEEVGVLMTLGRVEFEQGNVEEALQHLEAARRLVEPGFGVSLNAGLRFHLADVHAALGEPGQARADVTGGLALCQQEPGLFWEAHLLTVQAALDLNDGQVLSARRALARALDVLAPTLHTRILTLALSYLACTYATQGADSAELQWAARLWGLVEAQREASAQPLAAPHQADLARFMRAAERHVPAAAWQAAWADGRALELHATWKDSLDRLRTEVSVLTLGVPVTRPSLKSG
ncbi:helix-turn-helix domain-containing protein [Deinococcus sp. KSM4-11]|uniref:ATP-binding protein n=1 Tax=Deinococcus sp. KSM4-11 TaxID=2568654 RepID=UPI001454CCDF|nr:helix-turn-helix domain-containing protein [Deinococcus sp. KSM4-11]